MQAAVGMGASGRGEKQENGEGGFTEGWAQGLVVSWTLCGVSLITVCSGGSREQTPQRGLVLSNI